MSPLEQILFNQKKQARQLDEIMKLIKPVKETSEWITAEEAARLTGYKKETLRKKGLTKNYRAGKAMYNLNELKQKNLIN